MRMKRATNVSVDARLLAQARELDINLSKSLEDALRERIALAAGERWRRANAKAIEAHNERVAKKGLFSDRLRRF
jgi:antitoxin CcdA